MIGMGQLKYWLGKVQVPTEPGLSTAQLMLTNDDLEPGMDRKNTHPSVFCPSASLLFPEGLELLQESSF